MGYPHQWSTRSQVIVRSETLTQTISFLILHHSEAPIVSKYYGGGGAGGGGADEDEEEAHDEL